MDLVGQTQTPKNSQAAKAQIASLRVDKALAPLFDQQRFNPVFGQQSRCGKPTGARPDDQNRNMCDVHAGNRPPADCSENDSYYYIVVPITFGPAFRASPGPPQPLAAD